MTTPQSTQKPIKVEPEFDTVDLFGLSFAKAADEREVSARLLEWTPLDRTVDQRLPMVVTPNVDIVVQMHAPDRERVRSIAARSAVVLPDGTPIVWLSRLAGRPLPARLAGSTVFEHFWPALVADKRRVAVLASNEIVRDGLLDEYPEAAVVVAPMIESDTDAIDQAAAAFAETVRASRAEFCVIGLGHPKDFLLCESMIQHWPSDQPLPLILCLGASAEMYLGIRKRAPKWVQRSGFEWLFRFFQEPRRMFHRYFVRDMCFFPLAARELRSIRSKR